jgi:hypothetical protein
MTTALQPLPTPPPIRLRMAPRGTVPRRIDGAWWPRSSDLTVELPLLLGSLPNRWGRITCVTVDGAMWSSLPGRMLVANQVVRLRRARVPRDPHSICLLSPGRGRWDLLVVPPGTPEADADLLMTIATGNSLRP